MRQPASIFGVMRSTTPPLQLMLNIKALTDFDI